MYINIFYYGSRFWIVNDVWKYLTSTGRVNNDNDMFTSHS